MALTTHSQDHSCTQEPPFAPSDPALLLISSNWENDEESFYPENMEEMGECAMGCDWPDGPLAPGGCLW